jgi:hypothetical protein
LPGRRPAVALRASPAHAKKVIGVPGKTVQGSTATGSVGTRLKHNALGRRGNGGRRCGSGGAAGAWLEVGGGDVVLPVAHLEREVAEAALQDNVGRRGHRRGEREAACGRRGGSRRIWRPTAPGTKREAIKEERKKGDN